MGKVKKDRAGKAISPVQRNRVSSPAADQKQRKTRASAAAADQEPVAPVKKTTKRLAKKFLPEEHLEEEITQQDEESEQGQSESVGKPDGVADGTADPEVSGEDGDGVEGIPDGVEDKAESSKKSTTKDEKALEKPKNKKPAESPKKSAGMKNQKQETKSASSPSPVKGQQKMSMSMTDIALNTIIKSVASEGLRKQENNKLKKKRKPEEPASPTPCLVSVTATVNSEPKTPKSSAPSPSKKTDKAVVKKRVLKYARPNEKPKVSVTLAGTDLKIVAVKSPASSESTLAVEPSSPKPALKTSKLSMTEIALSTIIKSVAAEGIVKKEPGTSFETTPTTQPPPNKANKRKKIFTTKTAPPEIKITKVGQAIVIKNREKENFTINKLYRDMKSSDVISDRWCIPAPTWDPFTTRDVLLCYELDVLMDGTTRMKRCIKVLDNFELIVLLDGTDKTHLFKENHPFIKSTQEMLDLIRRVTMVKVCFGIKDCDPKDFENITSKVIERGGSWFSAECNVEVERGCLGNICKRCTSLRNSLRRKMRRQVEHESGTSSNTPSQSRNLLSNSLKPVSRTVGEALFMNFKHMCDGGRTNNDEMTLPPPSRSEQVFHPELKIYMNRDLKQRLDEIAANPPPPLTRIEHIVQFDPRTLTRTMKRVHTPIVPASFRNIISTSTAGRLSPATKRIKSDVLPNQSFVMGNNGEVTLVQTQSGETIQIPEGYVLADDSHQFGDNIVIHKIEQNQEDQYILGDDNGVMVGSNFTLEDGEEYEVIGEASGEGDSIQVLPLATNSNIEIIEVDENMIQLVDEHSRPEIEPVEANSDIFKLLQAHANGRLGMRVNQLM